MSKKDQPKELSADDLDMAVGGHDMSGSTAKVGDAHTQMAEEKAKLQTKMAHKTTLSAEAKKKHA